MGTIVMMIYKQEFGGSVNFGGTYKSLTSDTIDKVSIDDSAACTFLLQIKMTRDIIVLVFLGTLLCCKAHEVTLYEHSNYEGI